MDIVTHALLGAVAARSFSQHQHRRAATIIGAIAALLPDLDVLIRSSSDVLMTLTYHRHFTHSLLFAPLAALVASLFLWPLFRRHLSNTRLYGYALTGYISACLLDVCTSYGTYLLWPLVDKPLSLNIIAVIDPVFSLFLILALSLAAYLKQPTWCWFGLACAIAYLAMGSLQHQRAYQAAETLAEQRGVTPGRIIIKPTLANILLWRAVTVEGDVVWADAIRVGLSDKPKAYMGSSTTLIDPTEWNNLPPNSRAYQDLNRFYRLADHMLVTHPRHSHVVGDLRYAMLPDSVEPMWGIRIDPDNPDAPTEFLVDRRFTPAMRTRLITMMKGD